MTLRPWGTLVPIYCRFARLGELPKVVREEGIEPSLAESQSTRLTSYLTPLKVFDI